MSDAPDPSEPFQEHSLFDYFAGAMPRPGTAGSKMAALMVALLIHILLVLAFLLVAVAVPRPNPPTIVASTLPPKDELLIDKKEMQKESRKDSAPMPAPALKVLTAETFSPVSVPTMEFNQQFSPVGVGTTFGASMSFGGFGGTGESGMGGLFGMSGGGAGLKGRLFDLKQSPDGSSSGEDVQNTPGYKRSLRKLTDSRFDLEKFEKLYFRAPTTLRFSLLAIPTIDANEGPKAFKAEQFIQPRAWLIHYTGEIEPPEPGLWRFAGGFDDALVVFIDGDLVFDGSWDNFMDEPKCRESFSKNKLENHTRLYQGKWKSIRGRVKIDIIVGERPGGQVGGILMVEKQGKRYKERDDGSPILPLFTLVPIEGDLKERIDKFPYDFAPETPVFRAF